MKRAVNVHLLRREEDYVNPLGIRITFTLK